MTDYYKISDLVTRWKLSDSTVRRKIREGEIAIVRIGGAVRIEAAEVDRLESAWKAGKVVSA